MHGRPLTVGFEGTCDSVPYFVFVKVGWRWLPLQMMVFLLAPVGDGGHDDVGGAKKVEMATLLSKMR